MVKKSEVELFGTPEHAVIISKVYNIWVIGNAKNTKLLSTQAANWSFPG
jgi:hypothetical protein